MNSRVIKVARLVCDFHFDRAADLIVVRLPHNRAFQGTGSSPKVLTPRNGSSGLMAILQELNAATRTICAWYPLLIARLDESMSVGVPTPRGMLVLKRMPTTTPFSPCLYVAPTWVSNALTESRQSQYAALTAARTSSGLVLQISDQYVALLPNQLHEKIAQMPTPYTNVFYAGMLRHLPLAAQMTELVYGPAGTATILSLD